MNGLLQFQRASPETEQAVVFLQPADVSAESRDQSPENDLRKIPENRMGLREGFDKPCHNSRDGFLSKLQGHGN